MRVRHFGALLGAAALAACLAGAPAAFADELPGADDAPGAAAGAVEAADDVAAEAPLVEAAADAEADADAAAGGPDGSEASDGETAGGAAGQDADGASDDADGADAPAEPGSDASPDTPGELDDAADPAGPADPADQTDPAGTDDPEGAADPADPDPLANAPEDGGVYVVVATGQKQMALDVAGGSASAGANVRLWGANGAPAQKWYVEREDDVVTLRSVGSGLMLDEERGSATPGANVRQWGGNGAAAQKWRLEPAANGGFFLVNEASGLALDIAGGSYRSGVNVRCWTPNRSGAQSFTFVPANLLGDGAVYTFRSALGDLMVDDPGYALSAGVQLQVWTGNGAIPQKWRVQLVDGSPGTYTVQSVASGLFLAEGAGNAAVQAARADDDAQRWRVEYKVTRDGKSGGLRLVNAASGCVLDVKGGRAQAGTKLQTYPANNLAPQLFSPQAVPVLSPGFHTLQSLAGGCMLDVAASSLASGANVQAWTRNGAAAQVWQFVRDGSGWRIRSALSGKYLDVQNGSKQAGTNVRQWDGNGADAQLWDLRLDEDCGLVLVNRASGLALRAAGSGAAGSNVDQGASGTRQAAWRAFGAANPAISGDYALDAQLRGLAKRYSTLRSAFDYVARFPYVSGSKYPTGEWSVPFAKEMVANGGGNCYRYAALFKWMARAIGYAANVVSGAVPSVSSGRAAHGWVEIVINRVTYVFDPDMAHEIPSRNWYYMTYASAPIDYYK